MSGDAARDPAYMPALDGLRAFAVLVVVAFHAGALSSGWLGVEVFFVLSGYLITSLAVAEVGGSGTIDLRAFWGRRIRRLWPAICVYLLITLVVLVPRFVSVVPPSLDHLVATLTWRQNWQMIGDGGYGAGFRSGAVEHFWSLSIEEQFYVVWPVVLWLGARTIGRRWGAPAIRSAAFVGVVCSSIVVCWGIARDWSVDRLYLGSDTRVLGLFAGAALAGLRLAGRRGVVAASVGTALVVVGCLTFGDIRHEVLAGPLQAFTAVSALAVVGAAGLRGGPLTWRPVRATGRWSFGIYLWHVPISMIVGAHVASAWWDAVITGVVATAVAALSYRLVESPVRRRLRRGRWIAIGLTTAAVLCAAIGVVEVQPDLIRADGPQVTQPMNGPPLPRLVVIGDSVAHWAAPEIASSAAGAGWSAEVVAEDACVMSADPRDQVLDTCAPWVADLGSSVIGADGVVLWWGGTGEWMLWRGETRYMCDEPEAVAERYDALLDDLRIPSEVPVAIVLPSPRADHGAREQAGTDCERQAIADWADGRGVPVFDPEPARLAAGSEREVRVDGLHYTPLGAIAVTSALFDALAVAWPK